MGTIIIGVNKNKNEWQFVLIIMEICKAPTLRLKAVNKHTHIMYIEMENVILKKGKKTSTRVKNTMLEMRTHTHTVQTDRGEEKKKGVFKRPLFL